MDLTSYLLGKNSSGGGGGETTPQSLDDIATILKNYLINTPNSYTPLTTDSVTLYTPDADYKHYFIQKRSGGYYRIVWVKNDNFIYCYGQIGIGAIAITNNSNLSSLSIVGGGGSAMECYFGNEVATINDCINYAKNSNSYYTKTNNTLGYIEDTPYPIPVANIPVFTVVNGVNSQVMSQRISSNETIEVKS